MTIQQYDDHPFSSVLPLMEQAELGELAADIQCNGIRAPITLLDGKILDGRNRYRACQIAGVEPRFREYNGDGDPIDFIISVNVRRRHLSASQKAMVVAKILDLPRGNPKLKSAKTPTNPKSTQNVELGKTVADAADDLGVGTTTVTEAKRVLREGSKETIKDVETGKKSVATAVKEIKKTKEEKKTHYDKTDYPIPEDVYPDWQEAEAFRSTLNDLQRIKLIVRKAVEERILIFSEITNTTVGTIENAWSELQQVLPYAICPTCQGRTRKTCTVCKKRGFISKFGYEHWIPKETRELRERAIEK